jgi:hypothetical protein
MPKLVWTTYIPRIEAVLREHGFIWLNYAQENIPGMEGIPRNSWKKLMERIQKESDLRIECAMLRPDPTTIREKMVFFIEGRDIELLTTQSSTLNWADDFRRCLNIMVREFSRSGEQELSCADLAARCGVHDYPTLDNTSPSDLAAQRKRTLGILRTDPEFGPVRWAKEGLGVIAGANNEPTLVNMR